MNTDNLTPGDIIEYVTPSTNAAGGIIDDGGIFGTGEFIQAITRRKSKQIDIVLKNSLVIRRLLSLSGLGGDGLSIIIKKRRIE